MIYALDYHDRSKALKTKNRIELGITDPTHDRVKLVCFHLLQNGGWDRAWNWLQKVYGEDFLPGDSVYQLNKIIENHDLDVDVPEEAI